MLSSPRLAYRRLSAAGVDEFHALATDEHVKRYLMDGETVDRAWAEAEVVRSDAAFAATGAGLWLVAEKDGAAAVGFAGFRVFEEVGPEPQLLYAFLAPCTGRGYATEAARALISLARDTLGWEEVVSAVDAPNTASLRVLEKCGFRRTGAVPGAFGDIAVLRLP